MSRSQEKAMVIPFFDSRDLIHVEWIPQGQTVNKEYCCSEKVQGENEETAVEDWSVVVPPEQCPLPQVNAGDHLDGRQENESYTTPTLQP